jgi:(p)ppGpp synthase/HD superfamily hydrolase
MPGPRSSLKKSPRKKMLRKLGASIFPKKAAAKKQVQAAAAPHPADPLQRLMRAASFAASKHHGQMRAEGSVPYFAHVVRVTLVLAQGFGVEDQEALAAALLHDTIEDTPANYDEIAETFGERVAEYVVLLTKNALLPKKAREADYEARLREAPEIVKIIKMADLYDNLSDRIDSPKLRKTAQTAGRMLSAFDRRLHTAAGRAAHEKLSWLLEEIIAARPQATRPEKAKAKPAKSQSL